MNHHTLQYYKSLAVQMLIFVMPVKQPLNLILKEFLTQKQETSQTIQFNKAPLVFPVRAWLIRGQNNTDTYACTEEDLLT